MIDTKIALRSALGRIVAACKLAAILSFIGSPPVVAQLPRVYSHCANVDANPSAAIAACSAIIQSGRDAGRQPLWKSHHAPLPKLPGDELAFKNL
jgi:hypothetical protein